MKEYTKPALSFEQQADRLIGRGLIVNDRAELIEYLKRINYYRLSGYWYNFKIENSATSSESFVAGTSFEIIRCRYEFDRRLRLLFLDAIERIEVSVLRTRLTELHARIYGPFGYTRYSNYHPSFPFDRFQKLIADIKQDETQSYEEFIRRYRSRYSNEFLPLWMVTDLMPFGQLLTLYRNLDFSVKKQLALSIHVHHTLLDSWLLTLNYIRNACAHHSRLWNRPLAVKPKLPARKHDERWYTPIPIDNSQIFVVVLMIRTLMETIAPEDHWKDAFENLLYENQEVPLAPMGFPENWMDCPLWK